MKKNTNKSNISSKNLGEAITRVGGVAKDTNISLDQLIKIVKKVQKTTKRGGVVIGNALNLV